MADGCGSCGAAALECGGFDTARQGIGYDAKGPSSALPAQAQNAESITYLGNTALVPSACISKLKSHRHA
jgi:hypothetical protein